MGTDEKENPVVGVVVPDPKAEGLAFAKGATVAIETVGEAIRQQRDEWKARAEAAEQEVARLRAKDQVETAQLQGVVEWVEGLVERATCAFCAPAETPEQREKMSAHASACESHPLHEALKERDEARRERDAMIASLDKTRAYHREEAERRVRARGYEPGMLQARWRERPAPIWDQGECVDAILDALNREGVMAWDGDGVGCVQQIVGAFAADLAAARQQIEALRGALEKSGEAYFALWNACHDVLFAPIGDDGVWTFAPNERAAWLAAAVASSCADLNRALASLPQSHLKKGTP